MNPYLATILVALPSAALTGWVLPRLISRRGERNENLQSLSNRMAKERDRAEEIAKQAVAHTEEALAAQAAAHTDEIAKMRAAHQQEIAQLSQQLAECRGQLAECQERISALVGQVLQLRERLPPDARPPLLGPSSG